MKLETIQFDLGDGYTIAVETTKTVLAKESDGGLAPIGIADKTLDALKDSLVPLKSFATVVRDTLVSASPDETEVEFGVKIEGKSNLIITAGGIEANLKVTLKWKHTPPEH